MTDDRTTPFFEGVRFRARASVPVPPGTTCAAMGPLVTAAAGTSAGMVAVRGFAGRSVTSSPAAWRPSRCRTPPSLRRWRARPCSRWASVEPSWSASGRGPDLLGVGAPGLHLHGVTADRTAGGHVLSCVTGADVQLSVEPLDGVVVSGVDREAHRIG